MFTRHTVRLLLSFIPLLCSCGEEAMEPESLTGEEAAHFVAGEINRYREEQGISPFTYDEEVAGYAKRFSSALADTRGIIADSAEIIAEHANRMSGQTGCYDVTYISGSTRTLSKGALFQVVEGWKQNGFYNYHLLRYDSKIGVGVSRLSSNTTLYVAVILCR